MRSLVLTTVLLSLVLGLTPLAAPATAQPSGEDPGTSPGDEPGEAPGEGPGSGQASSGLWLATEAGVVEVEPTYGAVLLALADSAGARAVAVDEGREVLWYVTVSPEGVGRLGQSRLTGEPVLSLPAAIGEAEKLHLEVAPEDGTAWLAAGQEVTATLPTGLQVVQRRFSEAVVGLALGAPAGPGAEAGPVWIGTGRELLALDRISGETVRSLRAPAPVTRLAFDLETGSLWATTAETLLRYGLDGGAGEAAELELPEPGLSELVADGLGGVWALREDEVKRFLPTGEAAVSVIPFPAAVVLERAAADPATRSLWVSDGASLVRLSAAGHEQVRRGLGEGVALRDLAPSGLAREADPPSVEIQTPTDGAQVEEGPLTVAVRFSDPGAGVDPASAAVELDGVSLNGCTVTATTARCPVAEALAPGSHQVVARVADFVANVSAPAVSSFTVVETGQDPESPEEPPGAADDNNPAVYQPVQADRGRTLNKVYEFDTSIESISTSSGNLTLSIPLGRRYTVGPTLAYQLRLIYNSNVWQPIRVECPVSAPPGFCDVHPTATFSSTNPEANAGLGWEVHFGKLYAPAPPSGLDSHQSQRWPNRQTDSPDSLNRWLYVAPDGGRYTFHWLPGRQITNNAGYKVYLTKDGSHLRLQQVSAGLVKVEHPNGVVSFFEDASVVHGTNFCGFGVSGCWRFLKQRDPYGNEVSVSYGLSGGHEVWTITDSTGRQHKLVFDRSAVGRSGGDGVTQYSTNEGGVVDEWGDLRRKLIRAEVAAYGSATAKATYFFNYQEATVKRGCPHDEDLLPGSGDNSTLTTQILTGINGPLEQDYSFEMDTTFPGAFCSRRTGRMQSVTLPTGGKLAYEYGAWSFPTQCVYTFQEDLIDHYTQEGVTKKYRIRPDEEGCQATGTCSESWSYSSELFPAIPSSDFSGASCRRANYRRTTVVGPRDDQNRYTKTRYFHSVAQGVRHPSETTPWTSWRVTDVGLPYAKDPGQVINAGDPANALFLSRQIFSCGASCGTDPANETGKDRSVYLRYAMEYKSCNKTTDSAECWQVNPQLVAERTVYHDDGGRYVERRSSNWNGVGSPRTVRTRDDFDRSRPIREILEETDFTATGTTSLNPNLQGYFPRGSTSYLPSPEESWILHPYASQRKSEGGRTVHTDAVFEAEGQLRCTRSRKNASGRSNEDLVTKYEYPSTASLNHGLPTREIRAGGDGADLSTTDICSTLGTAGAGTKFTFEHEYQHRVRSRTRISGGPNLYRADIDRNTGLEAVTYDVSDQPTSYVYDALGRLKTVLPAASLQEARTDLRYNYLAALKLSTVELTRQFGGVELTYERRAYDDFGRLLAEVRRWPDTATTSKETARQTRRNARGFVKDEDTWGSSSSLGLLPPDGSLPEGAAGSTLYSQFDPFGWARQVRLPDGQVQTRTSFGVRKVDSTSQIGTGEGVQTPQTTTTISDSQGRVEEVITPQHATRMTYDPLGNVLSRTRRSVSGATVSQTRSYGYDGRGFLTSETLPELGVDGASGGTVFYDRDALGNVRQRRNGLHTLNYHYDNFGRLTAVQEGSFTWQEYSYGTSNLGNDYRKGKLVQAVRHNQVTDITFGTDDWVVIEDYEYRGALGQVSEKTTTLEVREAKGTLTPKATFVQGWVYDALGNVTALDYPDCVAGRCADGSSDTPGPTHRLTTSYNQGFPMSFSSPFNVGVEHSYHDNFQLSQTEFYSHYSFPVSRQRYGKGTAGLPRPSQITVEDRNGFSLFDSGVYGYDGGGNITAIGSDRYTYDGAGRLLSGTVKQAGSWRREDYSYDAFDNLLVADRDGLPWTSYEATSQNRVLYTGDEGPSRNWHYDVAGNLLEINKDADSAGEVVMTYDALGMQNTFWRDHPQGTQFVVTIYGPGNYRLLAFEGGAAGGVRTYTVRDLSGRTLRSWQVNGWGADGGSSNPGAVWSFEKDYLYGADGMFATRLPTGVRRFFHKDHLGTPRLLTDPEGLVKARRHYYPYGTEVPSSWGEDERHCKFTGHERDPHGGTDYMLGRTYAFPSYWFMSVDPGRDGWNLYAYGGENPVRYVDPDGREIYEKVHEVTLGNFHTSTVIIPDDQEGFSDDPRFRTDPDSKTVYATIGAGPVPAIDGNLESGINREKDADLGNQVEMIRLSIGGRDENEVIEELFQLEQNYRDNTANNPVDYDLFPDQGEGRSPFIADDGYNSNSFNRGLLRAAGIIVPRPRSRVPGFDKPLPVSYFEKKN